LFWLSGKPKVKCFEFTLLSIQRTLHSINTSKMKLILFCFLIPLNLFSQLPCNEKKMIIDGVYVESTSKYTKTISLSVLDTNLIAIEGLEVKTSNTNGSWNLYAGETNDSGKVNIEIDTRASTVVQIKKISSNRCIYFTISSKYNPDFEREIIWQ